MAIERTMGVSEGCFFEVYPLHGNLCALRA